MTSPESPEKQALDSERLQVLEQLEQWLEAPLLVLGFLWLVLLVVEFIWGLSALLQNVVSLMTYSYLYPGSVFGWNVRIYNRYSGHFFYWA